MSLSLEKMVIEFNALQCEVQSTSARAMAMEVENKQRDMQRDAMAFGYDRFMEIAEELKSFAEKFRALAKKEWYSEDTQEYAGMKRQLLRHE